ncbi:hypothetical protein Taro_007373 [Colocasia esculenta]|uniref:Uncharacterized protein n=1 Tax=Colocasia esculenta TaxID=4460 RepID=A0A843TUV3_COLES|nr:hypothetical protein [Colocasia esculenta]
MSGNKDYASPALSLSLAGVFRNAAQAAEEVEEGDEESGGGGCRGETVDVSSENTGTGRSEQEGDEDEPPEDDGEVTKNKKRKKYHRHTTEQIREMEALFKESPHPDEKQRQQLSKKLGLAPRQVKFWFQNRRTQIKVSETYFCCIRLARIQAMQERHENSLLKSEMDKLKEENRCMRETANKACCPNCGSLTSYKDSPTTTEVQQLRIENARLKSEVTWMEHVECQRGAVHTMYRPMVNSGVAFGAWHWMATLQQQCERLVFYMATNVPTKDSSGVSTLAGRKSTLKLAQRMTSTFCHAVGASSYHTWTKMSTKTGDDMRISTRKNLNDPGEPVGVILCAVSSVWLPVSAGALFDFLRDDARRSEAVQSRDSRDMWFLQDSCTNAYESMVAYAPVDVAAMQSVMSGCDSGSVAILPSGFSILPDGLDSSPPVITARPDERSAEGGGSLLTAALQVVANASPASKLTLESVEAVNSLVSSMLQSIKKGMQCEDG